MKHRSYLFISILAVALGFSPRLRAHAGHDKAPGEDGAPATGPVKLSAEAEKNLGLKLDEATLRTLEKTLAVLGTVEPDPAGVAVLASRISGRITRLAVKEGDIVAAGDFLLEVESRQIGDPPPRITFTAPIAGTVLERPVFTGDSVGPDTRLLTVADLAKVYVVGRVFEGQFAQVKRSQNVRVRAEAWPDEIFAGTVEGFAPKLDPETRTLGVRVRVDNPAGKLLPNMRATLRIVTAAADSVITVPLSAVLGEAGNYFVFVQDDKDPHTFLRTPVVLGQRDDRYVELVEGVLPGANVVTTGNYQLQYVAPAPAAKTADDDHGKAAPTEKKSAAPGR